MTHLLTVLNSSDPRTVLEINLERLDESLAFRWGPSRVNGLPTPGLGPPATGRFAAGEVWCDALSALWRCTAEGSPGTWVQLHPAVVAEFPVGPIPDGYRLARSDEHGATYYYSAAMSQWQAAPVFPAGGNGRVDSAGNLWLKGPDDLFRQLLVVLVDGQATLTLSDTTQT